MRLERVTTENVSADSPALENAVGLVLFSASGLDRRASDAMGAPLTGARDCCSYRGRRSIRWERGPSCLRSWGSARRVSSRAMNR